MADDDEVPDERDDSKAEIATNDTWRKIMIRARKTHKLTQAELGAEVGLSQVMISKIETGESGSSSEILAICTRLSIQVPTHYADEWQKKWAELGQVLRHNDPAKAEATLAFIETMTKNENAEPKSSDVEPTSEPPERSK